MASPPGNKDSSKSPPILPTEFLTPTPPSQARSAPRTRITASGSDVGVIRVPKQISQNDDRLSKPPSQPKSGSESGGSAPQSLSHSQIPFLDESPASYPVGHPYTQTSSSGSSQGEPKTALYARYARHTLESDSQPNDIVAFHHSATAEVSFTQSQHSVNNSFSVHSGSDESGSNRTQSSFASGSVNSRSSDSQISDISFANQISSTPMQTPPRPNASQLSTTSESDNSSSQQASPPTGPAQPILPPTLETRSQEAGPSQSRPTPAKPDNKELVVIPDDNSQNIEVFGTDPSYEEVDALFASQAEGSQKEEPQKEERKDDNPTQEFIDLVEEQELEEERREERVAGSVDVEAVEGSERDKESESTEDVHDATESTASSSMVKKRGRTFAHHLSLESTGPDYEYEYDNSDDDDDENSRSTHGYHLDLHISQSQASIIPSLPTRSRRSSVSVSGTFISASTSSTSLSKDKASSSNIESASRTDTTAESRTVAGDDASEEPEPATLETPAQTDLEALPDNSRSRPLTPPAPPQLLRRSSRVKGSSSQDPSSSQTFLGRLKAVEDDTTERKSSAKRRRTKAIESDVQQAASSLEVEQFFGSSEASGTRSREQSSEVTGPRSREQSARARSQSQDITNIQYDDTYDEDVGTPGADLGNDSPLTDGPPSPSRSVSSSTSKIPPPPRARGSRRRSISQISEQPSPRRSQRRGNTGSDGLREYRVDNGVWAKWQTVYYAGVISRKEPPPSSKYHIQFADGETGQCGLDEMRPLKLRLGARVRDSREQHAIVEGIHMAAQPIQSRVDVRYEESVEANLPIAEICLTLDMMKELDKHMDWEQEIAGPTTPSWEQPSSVPSSLDTSRKGKGKAVMAESSSSASMTPGRRGRAESAQSSSLMMPIRSGKDLFKDMSFVISLSSDSRGNEFALKIAATIKAGGGTVLDDYSSVGGVQRTGQSSVFLISYTTLKTEKYLTALALNIPRLSYRWIESCIEARQLLPFQSYQLPTGVSKELETTVSSTPSEEGGLFRRTTVGLCGFVPQQRSKWERILKAAEATVMTITAKTGPKECHYIVFATPKAYQDFCKANNSKLPSLVDEWITQCLINQRVMPIRGHPCYTDIKKESTAITTMGSSSGGT